MMEIAGQDAELPEMRRRAKFFGLFVMLTFLAIAARLFYLQIVEGDTFYRLTSDNIIRTDPLPAVRGQIRDRKNRRSIPHRLEKCGLIPFRNDTAQSGLWRISGIRQVIYVQTSLQPVERLRAARKLAGEGTGDGR